MAIIDGRHTANLASKAALKGGLGQKADKKDVAAIGGEVTALREAVDGILADDGKRDEALLAARAALEKRVSELGAEVREATKAARATTAAVNELAAALAASPEGPSAKAIAAEVAEETRGIVAADLGRAWARQKASLAIVLGVVVVVALAVGVIPMVTGFFRMIG